ncbi:hypothetical protein CWI41_030270 [Ordospora colligata]|nr:hypothetical protein CWI41_030270 [Ordospora colligata]
MLLASKIRIYILGEPLLKPPQHSPQDLFLLEFPSNAAFDVYLATVIIFVCIGAWLVAIKKTREDGTSLLYVIGFMLIFCSYCLQKAVELNKLISKATVDTDVPEQKWFWTKWLYPSSEDYNVTTYQNGYAESNILEHSMGKISSYLTLIFNNKGTNSDGNNAVNGIDKIKFESMNSTHTQIASTDRSRCTDKKSSLECVETIDRIRIENPSLNQYTSDMMVSTSSINTDTKHSDSSNNALTSLHDEKLAFVNSFETMNGTEDKAEKREITLRNLMRIFEYKHKVDEDLKRHTDNIRKAEAQTNKILDEFSSTFQAFMKEAQKIEMEMIGFNASTRYLRISLNELKAEIKKYFDGVPEVVTFNGVSQYLTKLEENYHKESEGKGDVGAAVEYEGYALVYIAIQTGLCLLFFIAVLLKIRPGVAILRPIISILLILGILISVLFLFSAQMLDRDCKSGSVNGCNFSHTFVREIRGTDTSKKGELKSQLDAMAVNGRTLLNELRTYVLRTADANVSSKIAVFSNLFNKIMFVYDDFEHLTAKKVNKEEFYGYVKMMNRQLEVIGRYLDVSVQKDMIEIYAEENAFSFWLDTEKDLIVELVQAITGLDADESEGKPSRWCVDALQAVCDAKDGFDSLFMLMFVAGPAFLALLYI